VTIGARRPQAEIEDHDAALVGDHHVRGLQIAVDEPVAVEGVEARGDLAQRRAQPPLVHGVVGADPVEDGRAGEQLHREAPVPVVVEPLAEPDQVAVREIGARPNSVSRRNRLCASSSRSVLTATGLPRSASNAS
jgi:hypothetical protein